MPQNTSCEPSCLNAHPPCYAAVPAPAAGVPVVAPVVEAPPPQPQPQQTYLDAVPPAATLAARAAASQLKNVETAQAELVVEAVNTLSQSNPTVSFRLETPLASTLYQELAAKGYTVSCQSKWAYVNGCCNELHHVTVSLPVVSTFWPRLGFFAPLINRWRF